ncbi:vacuolar protein sorting-associated protein 33B [Tribolium castaneum]|uniref:Vacuolar protein sorting-associated protein 33A-like Protein n=1 Tax=Tribolium castaneum TaxID=7070 RepID=D6WB77_TRICA|nr:PREDICTED: vacuolar protein sorting-associated protein 33B [Tribolium castaneum]EEZ98704.1 Vacuolar protein sorting-associated protein 33A-like Protein [Tribolium castaneum]|eukprot:XP_971387.1 PREDICTED: vacuolar protein sorting-associated protein 33B [Tribolium castaneum]
MDVNQRLSSFQEISKTLLSKIFSSVPRTKHIVIEPSVIRPLERVCSVSWLKGNGIEKIFKLEGKCPNFGNSPVFYMIFNQRATFRRVVDQIRSQIDQENPVKNRFHVIIVPHYQRCFDDMLEALGLCSIIKLHCFLWFPVHLDTGILSLELPHIYKKLFLVHDYTALHPLARALWNMFSVIGLPKFQIAVGEYSNKILRQIDLLAAEKGETERLNPEVGALIIIDRSVDYPSALLTPGTYSALLNEVYGVTTGMVECKESEDEVRLNPVVKKQPVKFTLDSNLDSIYSEIKNLYFTEVTSSLRTMTRKLKSEALESRDMGLNEMRHFVQKLLQPAQTRKKLIANHLLAAETIANVLGPRYETQREIEANIIQNTNRASNFSHLEESLCTEDDPCVTLRLFCLLCVTQKLTDSEIKNFWRKFLHQFGFASSSAMRYLINANFVPEAGVSGLPKIRFPKFTTKEFYANANKFKQIPANPEFADLGHPGCASYVFGGIYIPLVTKIAGMIVSGTPIEEIRSKLEGLGMVTLRSGDAYPLERRTVLIYFVGGVTYAEIAACNLLETFTRATIVVMSDRIVSGNDLMKQMLS